MESHFILRHIGILIAAVFFSISTWAQVHVEVRPTARGAEEVWLADGQKPFQKVGEVEVLKKGSLLYHWAKASPDQAKAWNQVGRIPKDVFDSIKAKGPGAAGAGFYTSRDPLDSIMYGNVQQVIELPEDIRILRTNRKGAFISWYKDQAALESLGLSGFSHSTTRNWINISEAEALTKAFVTDEKYYKDHPIKSIPQQESLKQLFEYMPGLQTEPHYINLLNEAESISADIKSPDFRTSAAALKKVLQNGSIRKIHSTIQDVSFMPSDKSNHLTTHVVSEFLKLAKTPDETGHQAIELLLNSAQKNEEIRPQVYSELLKLPHAIPRTLEAFNWSNRPDDRAISNLLIEASRYYGKSKNTTLQTGIESLIKAGRWTPGPKCVGLFL